MECGVLVKAFSILESLRQPAGGQPLRTLAASAGVTPPTAHRILATLSRLGYVQRGERGMYRLLGELPSRPALDPAHLLSAARPVLESLHRQTGETINLGVLSGVRIRYLLVLESIHPLRRVVQGGDFDPVHTTALGRAILSRLPDGQREALLAQLSRGRPGVPDRAGVARLRNLAVVAAREGYAFEENETDVGVACVATPVVSPRDPGAVAAISLTAPTIRMSAHSRARWIRLLQTAAQSIERRLKKSR